jgi:hypothetical protein
MMLRILIGGALVLLACSNKEPGTPAKESPSQSGSCTPSPNACTGSCNPCTRLADAQVTSIMGVPVSPGTQYTKEGGGDGHTCSWIQYSERGLPLVQVVLTANMTSPDCNVKSGGGITIAPVTGVGDEACYSHMQGMGPALLSFRKGCSAYSFAVSAPKLDEPTIEAKEKSLALAVLPNL